MGDCEWDSCENFQTAICLHCMRRLCIYHIQDHQEILLNEIDEIKNDVNEINIVLTNASNAIVEEYKAKENKCINWRQQKMDEIERDYNNRMQAIINRQKQLQQLELELMQRLKVEVQQPLEDMSLEKSINPQLLDTILLAIETVRRDSELLKWNPPK